jgi:uncharacterized protein YecT (DUF1311 family)
LGEVKAMKRLVVLFVLTSAPAFAQESGQYRACVEKAKTQMEMNACANDEAGRADAELDTVYSKLLAQAAKQPEALAKVKAAERAWIAYRDAYMGAMYPAKDKQAEYGTIFPMEADLLRARLTRRQVTALKELLEQYSGDQPMSNVQADHDEFVFVRKQNALSPGIVPKEGFVPDKDTAIAIACAVSVPVYGKEQIDGEKPLRAELENGKWLVIGTLHGGGVGRTLIVEIEQTTGRISYLGHSM